MVMLNKCPSMGGKCRSAGYAWLALNGVLYALAPRLALKMSSKMLTMGFENADELEPREWYQDATRATGVGMIATGLAGLAFERGGEDSQGDAEADEAETAA
ncbi:hypothetical protein [Halapricum desulfuricans]|nr:hypothetical protein [Halapricum desulfuricans]